MAHSRAPETRGASERGRDRGGASPYQHDPKGGLMPFVLLALARLEFNSRRVLAESSPPPNSAATLLSRGDSHAALLLDRFC